MGELSAYFCYLAGRVWRQLGRLALFGLLTLSLGSYLGCLAPETTTSPATQAFLEEIFPLLRDLQQGLLEPVSTKAEAEIHRFLHNFYNRYGQLCRDCPFQISVIDDQGQLLTTYPKVSLSGNFADYRLIHEPLTRRRIVQGRIFMPDGSSSYTISVPLVRKGRTQGVLVLNFTAAEVEKRWGLTAQEFLSLDLNRPPQ